MLEQLYIQDFKEPDWLQPTRNTRTMGTRKSSRNHVRLGSQHSASVWSNLNPTWITIDFSFSLLPTGNETRWNDLLMLLLFVVNSRTLETFRDGFQKLFEQ